MQRQTLHSIIAILFILSGAAALMYQIVWFRYFALFLGNTTYAQATVLATFMGGLAIGAWLWGRRADKSRNPLAVFAWLEIAIAIYCFLYPFILDVVRSVFISTVISLGLRSDGGTVLFMKLIVSISTILLPTVLMGGTLPVLVKFISRRIEESGRNVAILYFLNSFGAVVGSVLAGFFMVRIIGLQATIFSAASLDLIVGISALLLLRIAQRIPEFDSQSNASDVQYPTYTFTDTQIRVAVLVAGLSGLAAMVYEVAWVRMLIPVLGSSTYSFSLMLVAFISGITVGSWLFSVIHHRIKNLFGFLVVCQLGIVLAMVLTLPQYGRIPFYFWHVAHVLSRSEITYPIYLSFQFAFGFIIMFIPTLFMGMTLPVVSRIASRDIKVLGSSVGNVFSVNTIGTVVGSLAAGLALIPLIGVKSTIEFAIAVNLLCGLAILYYDTVRRRLIKQVYAVGAFAAVILYFSVAPQWNYSVSLTSVFRQINRSAEPPSRYSEFLAQRIPRDIYYYKEGTTATVAVVGGSDERTRILIVNGKPDASNMGDMPTQVLDGQIPMMLHPGADSVLVIGLGSGVTAGSVLTHPIRHLDIVEISPEVVEASEHFNDVNNEPFQDPRTTVYIDDALSFMKLTRHKYDVIISVPSNPWIAGIGNLYTIEFFEEARKKMRPGGLMVQWFHTYEMDDETLQLVLRTFHSVFPHITVWQTLSTDIVIVGSEEKVVPDFNRMKERFTDEKIARDLARIDIFDLPTLLSIQIMTEKHVAEYAGEGLLNTENIPYLEYWAPRAFFVNRGVRSFFGSDQRMNFGANYLYLSDYVQEFGLTEHEQLNVGTYHALTGRGNNLFGLSLLKEYHRKHPDDAVVLDRLARATERLGRHEESLGYLRALYHERPADHSVIGRYAWKSFDVNRAQLNPFLKNSPDEYISMLNRARMMAEDTVDTYPARIGDIYYYIDDYETAYKYYSQSLDIRARFGSGGGVREDLLFLQMARSLYQLERYQEAYGYVIQAIMANYRNQNAVDLGHRIGLQLRTINQRPQLPQTNKQKKRVSASTGE